MTLPPVIRIIAASVAMAVLTTPVVADVLETTNGARLVGSITQVTSGDIHLKTEYAGDIVVKQKDVARVLTDGEVSVRLASGAVLRGKISSGDSGAVKITGEDGELSTQVGRIAAVWPAGQEDPQTAALRRHWEYEAGVDIAGKTGNKEQLGTAVSARATLKTPQDTLQFYSTYDRQVSDGAKSSDQLKVGVDYQNNFAGHKSWYVRDEGGFDRVKEIDLYNVAAAGVGYDLIKQIKHTLTVRTGLAYRYEGYRNPATEDVSTAGLDIGLNHEWEFSKSKLVNRLAYIPSFEDFSNFRLTQESFYEVPLAVPSWKLRLGVSNDYNSKPGIGIDKLDTLYFTRLVLLWQ